MSKIEKYFYKNIMRFELLKVACEYQPETFEEKLIKELNKN